MSDKEFNLLHEPWICVMTPDADVREVSILDAFRHAHEYRALSGELPTQNVAILRLLLAILHAVFGRCDIDGNYFDEDGESNALCDLESEDAYDRWQSLWELGKFPMKPIEEYLSHYEERFYLFHPETPFYQVVDTEGTSNDAWKLNAVINQSNNKIRLFSPCSGKFKNTLSFSEAARWLIHIMAFDDSSTKKGTGTGIGWLGQIGIIYTSGNNLFESLLLNLVLVNIEDNSTWKSEKPYWEKPVNKHLSNPITTPDNLSELYTLQSRRIILKAENLIVKSFLDAGGDYFKDGNKNIFIEPMTAWEKNGNDYEPKCHSPQRQIWRELENIIAQANNHPPMIIKWLNNLVEEHCIQSKLFTFFTPSVAYGDKNSSFADFYHDSLAFNILLLSKLGEVWIPRIIKELKITDNLIVQLGMFAKNLALATGADSDPKKYLTPDKLRDEYKMKAYYELDAAYRHWLESIDPEQNMDIDVTMDNWWNIAKAKVREIGRSLIMQSGANAFVGHPNQMTSSEAYNLFLYKTSSRENLLKKSGGKK